MVGAKPEAIVNEVGVFIGDKGFETHALLGEAEGFEFPMGQVEDDGSWALVNFPRLDADEAVFDVIDPADAMLATGLVERFEQGHAVELDAIDGGGFAGLE